MARSLKEIQEQWDKDTQDQGYRVIPGHPDYEITMYGTIRNVKSQRSVKVLISNTGLYAMLSDKKTNSVRISVKHAVDSAYPDRDFKDKFLKLKPAKKIRGTATDQSDIPVIKGEKWRTIPEFPNYQISDYGRIKWASTGRFLTINTIRANLSKDGKAYKRHMVKLMNTVWGKQPLEMPK